MRERLRTSQSGDGKETDGGVVTGLALSQNELLALAEGIGHDHATLGIGVSDKNTLSAARVDDLVTDIGVGTDRVANQSEEDGDIDVLGLELGDSGHKSSNGSSTALVAGHASHNTASLDISSAGIVCNTLSDKVKAKTIVVVIVVVVVGVKSC